MNDVCTIERVPTYRRWSLMLARMDHKKPHLTLEEALVLMPEWQP